MDYGNYYGEVEEDPSGDYFDYGPGAGGMRSVGHAYNRRQAVAMLHEAEMEGVEAFAQPGVGGPFPVTIWARESLSSRRVCSCQAKKPTKRRASKRTAKKSARRCTCNK